MYIYLYIIHEKESQCSIVVVFSLRCRAGKQDMWNVDDTLYHSEFYLSLSLFVFSLFSLPFFCSVSSRFRYLCHSYISIARCIIRYYNNIYIYIYIYTLWDDRIGEKEQKRRRKNSWSKFRLTYTICTFYQHVFVAVANTSLSSTCWFGVSVSVSMWVSVVPFLLFWFWFCFCFCLELYSLFVPVMPDAGGNEWEVPHCFFSLGTPYSIRKKQRHTSTILWFYDRKIENLGTQERNNVTHTRKTTGQTDESAYLP